MAIDLRVWFAMSYLRCRSRGSPPHSNCKDEALVPFMPPQQIFLILKLVYDLFAPHYSPHSHSQGRSGWWLCRLTADWTRHTWITQPLCKGLESHSSWCWIEEGWGRCLVECRFLRRVVRRELIQPSLYYCYPGGSCGSIPVVCPWHVGELLDDLFSKPCRRLFPSTGRLKESPASWLRTWLYPASVWRCGPNSLGLFWNQKGVEVSEMGR